MYPMYLCTLAQDVERYRWISLFGRIPHTNFFWLSLLCKKQNAQQFAAQLAKFSTSDPHGAQGGAGVSSALPDPVQLKL